MNSSSTLRLIAVILVPVLLTGCEEQTGPAVQAPPVPVTIVKVETKDTPIVIEFDSP